MKSDVILDENVVEVQGNALKVKAWDIMLDSPDRRKNNEKPYRRALVHDHGDKLTMNWGNDYPGGVCIQGKLSVPRIEALPGQGPVEATNLLVFSLMGEKYLNRERIIACKAQDLILLNRDENPGDDTKLNKALSHLEGDKLVINSGGGYTGGVTIEGKVEILHEGALLDLVGEISNLRAEINDLKKRLAKIENKVQ